MSRTPEEQKLYMKEYRTRPGVREHEKAYGKEYRQRPKTKERRRIQSKEWLDDNPDQREKARLKTREWRLANPERKKESDRVVSRRKRDWIRSLKTGKTCECGFDDVRALEWHHREPKEKLFNITETSRTKEEILEEIKKCDLICANCHRMKHYNEG